MKMLKAAHMFRVGATNLLYFTVMLEILGSLSLISYSMEALRPTISPGFLLADGHQAFLPHEQEHLQSFVPE